MLFIKIIAVLLGLAFALFGYFIYFRKQYHLINGFQAEFEAGRKNTDYARRVGKVVKKRIRTRDILMEA